jgi:HK97 family phage portal protein
MEVSRDKSGTLIYTYYRDTDESGNRPKSGYFTLYREDILHIPGLGFDGLVGYSPIFLARNAIGMALATEQFGATFFANNAQPGGILESPIVIKDHDKLNKSWMEQFTGNNAHRIAILEDGLKFHQLSIPYDAAQFLESRKFQIQEIARIFRVPLHLLDDLDKSSFSNIEQQSLEFIKFTLQAWISRWEQSLQQALILPSEQNEYYIRFNVDGLLRGDYESRMKGYSIGMQNGFMSPNDIRALEGMNLIPDEEGGNNFYINGNMLPLNRAGEFAIRRNNNIITEDKQ